MRTTTWLAVALALVTAPATSTWAENDGSVSGVAIVEGKDAKERTVNLGGDTYRVLPQTRLLDERGQPIDFGRIRVAKESRREPTVDTTAAAYFEAVKTGNGWVLESLQLRDGLPR